MIRRTSHSRRRLALASTALAMAVCGCSAMPSFGNGAASTAAGLRDAAPRSGLRHCEHQLTNKVRLQRKGLYKLRARKAPQWRNCRGQGGTTCDARVKRPEPQRNSSRNHNSIRVKK